MQALLTDRNLSRKAWCYLTKPTGETIPRG
jgi:hypothetical protein